MTTIERIYHINSLYGKSLLRRRNYTHVNMRSSFLCAIAIAAIVIVSLVGFTNAVEPATTTTTAPSYNAVHERVATQLCGDTETQLMLKLEYDDNETCLSACDDIADIVPGNESTYGDCFDLAMAVYFVDNNYYEYAGFAAQPLSRCEYDSTAQHYTLPWHYNQIPGSLFNTLENRSAVVQTNNCSVDSFSVAATPNGLIFSRVGVVDECTVVGNYSNLAFNLTATDTVPDLFCDAALPPEPVVHKHIQTANQLCVDETTKTYLHLTFPDNTTCLACNISTIVPGDDTTYQDCFVDSSAWNFQPYDDETAASLNVTVDCTGEALFQSGATPWLFTQIPGPNTSHVASVHVDHCLEEGFAVNTTLGRGIHFLQDQEEICQIVEVTHGNNTYDVNVTVFNITSDNHEKFCDAQVTTTTTTTTSTAAEEEDDPLSKHTLGSIIGPAVAFGLIATVIVILAILNAKGII